jgi:DNA-binding CsgD family transcriptional regulator
VDARSPTTADGLLEREREFEALELAVAEAAVGAGSVIAIEGDAGIGKSSLLAHAVHCATETGMRVLSARGGELEREFAYGLVRQLFEAPLAAAQAGERERWLAGAAGLASPVLPASEPGRGTGSDPSSVLHGLYWLSANLSVERPLLIAIDDAHWADDASIGFLSYLARRTGELAIALVYVSRLGEGASAQLPALAEPALVSAVLRPAALSRPGSAELVAQQLQRPGPEGFADACHTATSGNPFLLRELLRALASAGAADEELSAARVERIAPEAIARSTLARLRRLGPDAGELARAVAVLGKSAELHDAAALARLDTIAAAEAADALAVAAILRDGRPLEFIHPIVRTTIYDELAPGRRAASHKRAALLLSQAGAGDVEIAPHLLAAEPGGDFWVVERLRSAASEVLERGAPAAACAYLERAVREPAPEGERAALLLALGSAELAVARPAALEHLRAALAGARDSDTRYEAARQYVWALGDGGRRDEAVELGLQLLAEVPAEDEERAMLLRGELAALAQFAPAFARAALERLRPYEGRLRGETSGERVVLACLAFGAASRGESPSETADLAELALAGDRLLHEHPLGSLPYFFAGWALMHADRLDAAGRCFDLALDEARARGSTAIFASASACRCQVLIRQGRLTEAEAEVLSVLSGDEVPALALPMLRSALLHTMIERVEPPAWPALLREHELDGELAEGPMTSLVLLSRAQLRLAAGEPHLALADLDHMRERDERSGLDNAGLPVRGCRALAHLQLGERDAARTASAQELERARRWSTPSALAFALRTAGLVEGGAAGIELLRESVASVAGSSASYEHARSLTELGAALRRANKRLEARGPLREGLDLADRCGALRLSARAREELVAAGARPRRSALRGRDALTPSERRVAGLAADGLSNREIAQALFVTMRTVEGHLTQSYAKLDIASREELAPALVAPAG